MTLKHREPEGVAFMKKERRYPTDKILSGEEFDDVINRTVLQGLTPDTPILNNRSKIVTIGSCFAQNIAKNLKTSGYDALRLDVTERLFTAFALRTFVENLNNDAGDFSQFKVNWGLETEAILSIKEYIKDGATVIVTLGLSICWFDKETGEMVFDPARKIGANLFYKNIERYEMRHTSSDENVAAIVAIINALKSLNHKCSVIFTLSPIPLRHAACDYPVSVADCISKTVLRSALHEITMLRLKGVYYFPSFEILRWMAGTVDTIWFEDDMLNHIRADWIEYTLSKFKQFYCAGETGSLPPAP